MISIMFKPDTTKELIDFILEEEGSFSYFVEKLNTRVELAIRGEVYHIFVFENFGEDPFRNFFWGMILKTVRELLRCKLSNDDLPPTRKIRDFTEYVEHFLRTHFQNSFMGHTEPDFSKGIVNYIKDVSFEKEDTEDEPFETNLEPQLEEHIRGGHGNTHEEEYGDNEDYDRLSEPLELEWYENSEYYDHEQEFEDPFYRY